MATNVTSVTKHYPSAQDGFTTTLASTISSGAATVPLNSVAGYTNGQVIVFIVDPTDATKKQAFTGTVDTAGVQITGVVWTSGTNQTHTTGATVVDYESATAWSMITKGLLSAGLTQAGGMGAITPTSIVSSGTITATNFIQSGGAGASGWTVGLATPNTVTALGNRSYSMVFNTTDLTGTVSSGMRLRTTRTVTAPTQSTSLNGTTQYYSKTSPSAMTFTDDFTVSAWIKLTAYPGTAAAIATRYNGTSGWQFYITASGQVGLNGVNAGAANLSNVQSYQSVPLNKWVHVAAQLDMSAFTATTTTSYTMIDGVDVPAAVARSGTNPITLIQAGNLEIGGANGGTTPLTGKIAQVAIYNAKVTQATILASIHQTLSGSETSLISAYSFNNTINDLSANANNLTANGAAVATNADSPFGGQADGTVSSTLDYAIITKTAFSTNTTLTVQVPEGCTLPTSGGVSAVSYSTQKIPYLFPAQRGKWSVATLILSNVNANGTSSNTTYNFSSLNLNVPIGEWVVFADLGFSATSSTSGLSLYAGLSSSSSAFDSGSLLAGRYLINEANSSNGQVISVVHSSPLSLAAATPYYPLIRTDIAVAGLSIRGAVSTTVPEQSNITAELAYL